MENLKQTKLRAIGNSTGVVLPKEALDKLSLSAGDTLYVIETKDGIELTPYDPEFGSQLDLAKSVMKKRRNVLRKLAE